jgi:hypothetical protein
MPVRCRSKQARQIDRRNAPSDDKSPAIDIQYISTSVRPVIPSAWRIMNWARCIPNVQSLRGDRLSLIGAVSGSAAMYRAMTSLGFASGAGCNGPIKLDDDPMDPRGRSDHCHTARSAGLERAVRAARGDHGIDREIIAGIFGPALSCFRSSSCSPAEARSGWRHKKSPASYGADPTNPR